MVLLRRESVENGGLMSAMDEILEPKEVAQLLKVNHRTVVRWAEQGKLPGFKLGDLWRFRREAIEEYIRQLEKGTITFADANLQEEKPTVKKSAPKDSSGTPSANGDNQDQAGKS
jgi:excisionase family DNA binding protein